MQKFIKTIFITLLLMLVIIPHVSLAQTASPSAETDQDLVKEKLKERLEKTLSENPIPKRIRWYGIFGTISAKTGEDTFSLTKNDSSTATIVVNDDTQLSFFKSGVPTRKIKAGDIQQDWFAIAMGTEMADNQTLTASRISFSVPQAKMPKREIIYGKVTEIDEDSVTLSNGKITNITFPKKYILSVQGVEKPAIEDINIDDKAVAIVEELADGDEINLSIKNIYVVPSNNNPKAASNQINEASGSANPSPSASPNTKVTPKP